MGGGGEDLRVLLFVQALVAKEKEGFVLAVVEMGDHYGSADVGVRLHEEDGQAVRMAQVGI